MADCVFCKIVAGRAEAEVVLREGAMTAFLDARPLFPGHVLLVPDEHHETLLDLPSAQVGPLLSTTQRLARAVRDGLGAEGSFVAMNNRVSQSVPHLHVHVVPRTRGDGLRGFFWPRRRYREGEMAAAAEAIRSELGRGGPQEPGVTR